MKQETVPKSEQTTLLEYRDWDSITAVVDNNLSVIKLIGQQTAKGESLFKTKKVCKAQKLIYMLHSDGCDFGRLPTNWNRSEFFAKIEKLKCLFEQQKAIINTATQIYAEGYKKCSSKKMSYIFGALNMIEDVIKAVDVLEQCYRKDFPAKRVA